MYKCCGKKVTAMTTDLAVRGTRLSPSSLAGTMGHTEGMESLPQVTGSAVYLVHCPCAYGESALNVLHL